MKFYKPLVSIAGFVCLSLIFLGCSGQQGPGSEAAVGNGGGDPNSTEPITICLLPKIKGISYFTSCAKGAQEAAAELNVKLIYDGPTDGDPRKQAEMIESWIVEGVDAICVAPNAPDVVAGAMREAMAAGIQVVTWDADGLVDSRSVFVNQATTESVGKGMVNAMIDDLGADAEGDVVIISSDPTSDNQNRWIEVMKPAIEASKLRLATIKYPGENAAKAQEDAQDVLKKYDNLKGIFGISSVAFPGAAEAVEQAGMSGKVLVTGVAPPNDMKKFVHNGTVKTVVLWNTIDLGYLTIHVANALARGAYDADAEIFRAGRLGELKMEGDNVILGDIIRFTNENIDDFDF